MGQNQALQGPRVQKRHLEVHQVEDSLLDVKTEKLLSQARQGRPKTPKTCMMMLHVFQQVFNFRLYFPPPPLFFSMSLACRFLTW